MLMIYRIFVPGLMFLCCSHLLPAPGTANTLPVGFQDQFVAGYFVLPTSMDFLPDGRILVVEKDLATVRLVVNGTVKSAPILTLPDVNTDDYGRGVMGIAVDPSWPVRPYVYIGFTRTPGNVSYLSRFKATGQLSNPASMNLSLGQRYDILVDIPDINVHHNGGTVRFGPDGMLFLSTGDDGFPCEAQDSTSYRGKILRLNVAALPDTGSGPPPKSLITPPDNPFPPTDPEAGLVFCRGLRHPFRFHVDPRSGRIFIGDVGETEFEELDVASGGENFGWPYREGPYLFGLPQCQEPGGPGSQTYASFIAGYDRAGMENVSIISGPRYWCLSGAPFSFPPQYNGAVFYAEFYEDFVRVIRQVGDSWLPLPAEPGQPNPTDWAIMEESAIVDWLQGSDGALYYLTLYPGSIGRIVYTGSVTGVEHVTPEPAPRLQLHPNPYRAGQMIEFEGILEDGACLEIISLDGRLVSRLEPLVSGALAWDGRDEGGRPVASGVYLLRERGSETNRAARLVLLP